MYKELINQRLNIIYILKKLEVIEIPEKKIKTTLTNHNVFEGNFKLSQLKTNNYICNNIN